MLPLAQGVGQAADDQVAQLVAERFQADLAPVAGDLADQPAGVVDPQREAAEAPQPHRSQFRVPHDQGMAGAPLEIGEQAGGDEVHLRLERALAAERQGQQAGEDRQIAGRQHVAARSEAVGDAALVDEHGPLAFAHDQLGAEPQGIVVAIEAPDDRARLAQGSVIGPFDDVDAFPPDRLPQMVHRHAVRPTGTVAGLRSD